MSDFSPFTTISPPRPTVRVGGSLRVPAVPAPLLPKHLRPHLSLFYRFVQIGHRIADDPDLEPEVKRVFLEALDRALITGKDNAGPVDSALELRSSLIETGVSDRHAHQILRALRRDATSGSCATWDDLLLHCRQSAVPIGRYLLDLHGEGDGPGLAVDPLFMAIRILGLMQSARADWMALGRCRLPLAWFDDAGISVERLVETRCDEDVRSILDRVLDCVDFMLAEADVLPGMIRHAALRLELAVMLEQARALSRRLRRRDPLRRRVELGSVGWSVATARGLWRAIARR